MKNSQEGFVVPLLIVIIALLIVGSGVYIYESQKTEAPITQNSPLTNNSEPCTRNGSMGTYKCKSPVLKINGPQSLDLNQLGTWTVDAYSPNDKGEGSTLTYSVKWGDSAIIPKFGTEYPPFTHAYSKFGTYTIIFTAKDWTGAETSTSTSVSVINSTNPGLNTGTYKIYNDNVFGFFFEYPTNWSVKQSFYATPGQQYNGEKGDVVALVVTSPTGMEIVIGGRQAECQLSTSTIKVACFKNIPITTTATDTQSILVFNHLVATLSSKY